MGKMQNKYRYRRFLQSDVQYVCAHRALAKEKCRPEQLFLTWDDQSSQLHVKEGNLRMCSKIGKGLVYVKGIRVLNK